MKFWFLKEDSRVNIENGLYVEQFLFSIFGFLNIHNFVMNKTEQKYLINIFASYYTCHKKLKGLIEEHVVHLRLEKRKLKETL